MLKKSDLSKEFELVVKQEIKNYNDSLNFILQSINSIKKSIEILSDDYLDRYASMQSYQTSLSIKLDKLKEELKTFTETSQRFSNDQISFNSTVSNDILNLKNEMMVKSHNDKNTHFKIQNIWKDIEDLKHQIEVTTRVVNENLDDLLRKFRKEIEQSKKDILEAPSETSIIKEQLEEKISCHKIDVAGIMRELNIYKKENFITQKKIENIYTLIDRLSKSEG